MNELINIENKDGVLLVSSREVAERFGKEHKHVIRDIENIVSQRCDQNWADLFIASSYLDSYKRGQKEYLLTRDGFSLLAMGFTGSKALEWKQRSMEMGLFEIKETSISHSDGHITVNKTPKVTGKGQIYFINKLRP